MGREAVPGLRPVRDRHVDIESSSEKTSSVRNHAAGGTRTDAVGPVSTSLPVYMTASSSATWPTTPRSWVDKDNRQATLQAKLAEQGKDLCLDSHVEHGRRLVAQQDRRLGGERDGDHDSLACAARELMRISAIAALRIGDAHLPRRVGLASG